MQTTKTVMRQTKTVRQQEKIVVNPKKSARQHAFGSPVCVPIRNSGDKNERE
jgi:hypothetical protein